MTRVSGYICTFLWTGFIQEKGKAMAAKNVQSSTMQDVKLSKTLSYILRHGAQKEGLQISSSGLVRVNDLLKHPKFKQYTLQDIKRVVEQNEKQRFALVEDSETQDLLIRANQGHTISVDDLDLEEVNPSEVPVAIHGTYASCIESIKKKGLSRMKRQHIHMATDMPGQTEVISGMRQSCDYVVYVDVKKASDSGLRFYKSANNVILCSGDEAGFIHPRFFIKIKKRT